MAAEAQKNRPSSESRPRLSGHDALCATREKPSMTLSPPHPATAHSGLLACALRSRGS